MASALRPRLGDEHDLFHARFAREVHDLHDLGVGQLLVRLEVDHLPALGHVLELLLELGHEVVLVVELGPPRYVVASFLIATVIVFASSFLSLVLPARGSFTSTPFWSMGVITMKMMSSTIMMSAMGATLMSDIAAPFLPPTAIDMGRLLDRGTRPAKAASPGGPWRAFKRP